MTRPTRVHIDAMALRHNLARVKEAAPNKRIIAMVKANAYGCGLESVLPVLDGHVDAFGVASLEEAMRLRQLGRRTACILFQGLFHAEELLLASKQHLQCVMHHEQQVRWLLNTPLSEPMRVWVKVDTGMHRLGFSPDAVEAVIRALSECPWVDAPIGLMTHLACADEPCHALNHQQMVCFEQLSRALPGCLRSVANSAAILALPDVHLDVVRPGIMLYGVSPFARQTGMALGLRPVMQLISQISAIHHCPAGAYIGYGATWQCKYDSKIGVVPVGYGDGYPRHVHGAWLWIAGRKVPLAGRVSMDSLTIDLTNCPDASVGDNVELWGQHVPIELVAKASGTIAYELLCQVSSRAHL